MFSYTAKDSSGAIVTGTIDGNDKNAAISWLREKGYFILDLKPAAENKSHNKFKSFFQMIYNPIFNSVNIDDMAIFYRQMSTMIKSGMSVLQSLQTLNNNNSVNTLKFIVNKAYIEIQNGGTLSGSLSAYPWIFKPLHLHLLRAGETGGSLDIMLDRLASYVESERKLRQQIRMSTLYPKILILAAIFIPKLPVLVLGDPYDYLRGTVGVILPVLGIIFIVWLVHMISMQNNQYRYGYGFFVLIMPVIGKMLKMLALTKFYKSFSCLYASGISPTEALKLSAETTGNSYLSAQMEKAVPLLADGHSMAEAFAATEVFPAMTINMMNAGVQSGNIDTLLDKAAEYTESESELAIHRFLTIAPVLIFLVIALYIGYFVISSYVGMYSNIIAQ